jgi:hypothetical protein
MTRNRQGKGKAYDCKFKVRNDRENNRINVFL